MTAAFAIDQRLSRCALTGSLRLDIGGDVPTPLVPVSGLESYVAGANLFIKRDDRFGLLWGGNKYRQMEFMFAEAIQQGADVIVATGAVQSNLVCAAAAIARRCGMDCVVQHEMRIPRPAPEAYFQNGNRLLLRALGAEVLDPPLEGDDEVAADAEMARICGDLRNKRRNPYPIYMGSKGSKIGALGYVRCAKEILDQCAELGVVPDYIFLPSGSGLTHIGVLLGLKLLGSKAKVTGICVRRSKSEQFARLYRIALSVQEYLDIRGLVHESDISVWDSSLGQGYGIAGPREAQAIKDFAQRAGCILDPVYSGKCVTGMKDFLHANPMDAGANCVFLHTGGGAATFAYPELLDEE